MSPDLNPGGAQRQMLILAAALPRDQFDVRFILLAERGLLAGEADALGLPVHVLGIRPLECHRPGSPACLAAIGRALARYLRVMRGVDIVDAWLVPALTFVGLAQPVARIPVFIAGRRSLAGVARPRSRLRRVGAWLAMRRADTLVANSQAAARDLILTDRVPPRKVRVISNAVVPPSVAPDDRERLRADWGARSEDLVVGCVANYRPGKGLPLLLDAAADLREGGPNLRWVLVGDGPLRSELLAAIRERGLSQSVLLQTDVTDARELYAGFDILVQASESEGLPNAVLEAAAAGLPIVATDVGGTSEIIDGRGDGLLVPKGDRVALTGAIRGLAVDPAARRRLGEAALARAGAFSPAALAERTAALYLELAGHRQDGRVGLGSTGRRHSNTPSGELLAARSSGSPPPAPDDDAASADPEDE